MPAPQQITALAAKFFAKVYDLLGGLAFISVIDTSKFISVPKIVRETGKPAADVTIDFAVASDVKLLNPPNLVALWAANEDNPGGVLTYKGTVEEPMGTMSSQGSDFFSARLFPIDALLSRNAWKKAGSYAITYTATAVETIISDALAAVNADYGSIFTPVLGTTGVNANLSLTAKTPLDWINAAFALLDDTWYWRIEADGTFRLAQWSDVTATHKFTVGLDVDGFQVTESLLTLANRVVVAWGSPVTYSEYNDATSQATYGKRTAVVTNSGVTNLASSDVLGAATLAKRKNPLIKATATINARYPLTTILPGDTCLIRNLRTVSGQMLTGVLRIVRVEYDGVTATLQLSDIFDNYGKELATFVG